MPVGAGTGAPRANRRKITKANVRRAPSRARARLQRRG